MIRSMSSPEARYREHIQSRHAAPAWVAPHLRPRLDRTDGDCGAGAQAMRADWAAHVAAGRIGVAPPAPVGTGEHGCASLAAILGPAR